jgi:S1-C subfamily serine protease
VRWTLRGVAGGLAVLLIAVVVRTATNMTLNKARQANAVPTVLQAKSQEPPPAALPVPASSSPLPAVAERPTWEQAVVAIESRDQVGPHSVGSGFFVADTGFVATNLHVTSQCTEATVRLADGTKYEIAGYVAVDPAHDLALLALKNGPAEIIGLPLADSTDPPRRTAVWAIGHPQGIEFSESKGEVSRVLVSSDLPAASQRFLRELAPSAEQAKWIQHSAPISPGSSGGPLLDGDGRVLGINTWVDREAQFHYALHVAHLRTLLSEAKSAAVIPLVDHATPEARANQQLWELSADRVTSLLEQGRGMRWQPQSREDYRLLQQLAWAITVARLPDTLSVRGSLGDRLDDLARVADQSVMELSKEKWNQLGQVTFLNEYAEPELRRPLAGLFFFATIERAVEGNDGRRGLIATLAGFDEPVFLALEDQLIVPEAGSQCLVLGVNLNGRTVQWGDNPLKLKTAPVIVPGVMVKLGEP